MRVPVTHCFLGFGAAQCAVDHCYRCITQTVVASWVSLRCKSLALVLPLIHTIYRNASWSRTLTASHKLPGFIRVCLASLECASYCVKDEGDMRTLPTCLHPLHSVRGQRCVHAQHSTNRQVCCTDTRVSSSSHAKFVQLPYWLRHCLITHCAIHNRSQN